MNKELDHHAALIYAMVLVSAAEGRMSDRELEVMGRLVRHLPAFQNFDPARIIEVGKDCAELLEQEDGLEVALERMARSLPQPLRETAYVLACDVAAADGRPVEAELRMLELIRHRLHVDRLVAAAIERAAQARHHTA
ncbi:tellurite resistance TerB family protein [Benzoatithermus flavus]|uniref:Tellurite resistance TerB family protein n=1 Tax=Benzoatithermus flavus TaxID=3108223 RepID=A0ABU8XLD4_9PROT